MGSVKIYVTLLDASHMNWRLTYVITKGKEMTMSSQLVSDSCWNQNIVTFPFYVNSKSASQADRSASDIPVKK